MIRHPRFDEALALHRRVPVVDGHADSILAVLDGQRTLVERAEIGQLDFPRAREGGLAATVQTAWPAPAYYPVAASRVFAMVDAILAEIEAAASSARLVTTAAEIRTCHREGRLGVLLNVEGAEALQAELGVLRALHRLGVRLLQPVWNHRNAAADGVMEDGDGGLSNFGRALVREMNRLGMAVDASHLTRRGFFDLLELSEQPILFSHGNCRALHEHRRNLADDQIRALADRGGVFGISVVASFMADGECDVAIVADHVEHAIKVAGPAHVAYGSDFDGTDRVPSGLESVDLLPNLTAELLARGHGEAELAGILGGNYLRVFEAVFG
ncbi:MAG TPA: dipeptidase [Chloroflexota bacterium]|jgi:membrane dipeptidase